MRTLDSRPALMTPDAFMAGHWLTTRLNEIGWTSEDLDRLDFEYAHLEMDFDDWAMRRIQGRGLTAEELALSRAYAALKWQVFDAPSEGGRAVRQAWECIRLAAERATAMAAQANRAQKPRRRIDKEGNTINDVIAEVVRADRHGIRTGKQLWGDFKSTLAFRGLDPKFIGEGKGRKETLQFILYAGARESTLTRGAFENTVSKLRKAKLSC